MLKSSMQDEAVLTKTAVSLDITGFVREYNITIPTKPKLCGFNDYGALLFFFSSWMTIWVAPYHLARPHAPKKGAKSFSITGFYVENTYAHF